MTNKILRKLTLSAVTLGVAAVSATTSTFAWFTTNSEVTASKVDGNVKEADGNMLLSVKNGTSWQSPAKTVTLPAGATSLAPVQATSTSSSSGQSTSTTYSFTKSTSTGTFSTATDGTEYIHYELIFHMSDLATGDNIKNVVTANFNNFAGGNGSQYLLVDASTEDGGAKAGDTIKVNLLDVLSMCVKSEIITESNKSTYSISDTNLTGTLNSTNKFYRYNTEKDTVSVNNSEKKADALTYYKNVYSDASSVTRPQDTPSYETTYLSNTDNTKESSKAGITLFEVTGTSKAYVKTDIYFYIDGWDKQCFNAAGGLKISAGSIDFKLTTASTQTSSS